MKKEKQWFRTLPQAMTSRQRAGSAEPPFVGIAQLVFLPIKKSDKPPLTGFVFYSEFFSDTAQLFSALNSCTMIQNKSEWEPVRDRNRINSS